MTHSIRTDTPARTPPVPRTQDPVTDTARLLAIARYDLDSPALKLALNRFAEEAAHLLGLPVGLVSVVLDGAQLFAGRYGLDGTWLAAAGGTPVEWAFCASAVRSGSPYVVPNAETDPQQADNPLVVFDGIRSYAGAPLISPSGQVLGTCCTMGTQAREFTGDEVQCLEALARRIVVELELHTVD